MDAQNKLELLQYNESVIVQMLHAFCACSLSTEISCLGTFAISSLMTSRVLDTFATADSNQTASLNTTTFSSFWCAGEGLALSKEVLARRIEIAMVLAMLVGLCQVSLLLLLLHCNGGLLYA